jgi:fucose 4-O-acetylase-like acetyltransferase
MTIAGAIKNRDSFLDIAKGLAIILVVVGHVIQGSSEHFDDLMGFKMIYSFHMPLFIFLSGAVAAISFDALVAIRGLRPAVLVAGGKIQKAVIRLLIPFIAWCVLNQLIYHHADSVWGALVLAFRRPDTALWFLLAIFYCVVLTSILQIVFALILWSLSFLSVKGARVRELFSNPMFQVALMILIWWAIKGHTPHGAGLSLLKPYFIYYALGLGFYKFTQGNFSIPYSLLGGIVFFALVPFWLRTAQFQYVGPIALPDIALYFYAGVVAIAGTWIFLGCARLVAISSMDFLKRFLILCGQLSLGIYAIHYFFLAYSPKILVPLLASLMISYLLNKTPVMRTLFLGER